MQVAHAPLCCTLALFQQCASFANSEMGKESQVTTLDHSRARPSPTTVLLTLAQSTQTSPQTRRKQLQEPCSGWGR